MIFVYVQTKVLNNYYHGNLIILNTTCTAFFNNNLPSDLNKYYGCSKF